MTRLVSLQSIAKRLGTSDKPLRKLVDAHGINWQIAVPTGENILDKRLKKKGAARKCVLLKDMKRVEALRLPQVTVPTGHDIRRAISEHRLSTERKFDAFRHLHPELGFPCATTVKETQQKHGWDWKVKYISPEYWATTARNIAVRGLLPTKNTLVKSGYYALVQAAQKYPEKFRGLRFKVVKTGKGPHEWLKIAKRLAKGNGGQLPIKKWLADHGYSALLAQMIAHPEVFVHLKQEKHVTRTPQQHVAAARKLEKEHGKVPEYVWLIKNGFRGLAICKNRRPALFKGIVFGQDKVIDEHKLAERVALAKKLAKQNGGVLPSRQWLYENGYGALKSSLYKFPKAFADIPQKWVKLRTVVEWVQVAAKLAKKNNGRIPSYTKLYATGNLTGLCRALQVYPKRFSKWEQDTDAKERTVQEWLAIAKQIAPDKIFPPMAELKRMGYQGILDARKRHPRLLKEYRLWRSSLHIIVRNCIAKNRLDTPAKYVDFRLQHPELRLPRIDNVRRLWRERGWNWSAK